MIVDLSSNKQPLGSLHMSFFMDGTFIVHSELDAHYASRVMVDYIATVPVTSIITAINEAIHP